MNRGMGGKVKAFYKKITQYTFEDVLIVPTFNENLVSRRNISKEISIGNTKGEEVKLSLPIISSPMSFYWKNFGKELVKRNVIYSIPRINRTIDERIDVLNSFQSDEKIYVAFSIGVNELKREEARKEFEKYLEDYSFILIDTAFGSTNLVIETLQYLSSLGVNRGVIVGNVASLEGLYYLAKNTWDKYKEIIVRVGIGSGSACTTRLKTGVGFPQLAILEILSKVIGNTSLDKGFNQDIESIIFEFSDLVEKVNSGFSIKLISDGGVKYTGDIAKALVYSDMVMLGKLLISKEMETYDKESDSARYYGMASIYVGNSYAEGDIYIKNHPRYLGEIIEDIQIALGSSMSYVGAGNLDEFRKLADFIMISNNSWRESLINGV